MPCDPYSDVSITVCFWLSFLKQVSSLVIGAFGCYSVFTALPHIFVNNINEPRSDRRDLLAINVKSEIYTEKKELAVVNNYRKFDEIIFTNNKDMSV